MTGCHRILLAIVLVLAEPSAQRFRQMPPAPPDRIEQLRSEVEELRNSIFNAEVEIYKLQHPDMIEPSFNARRLEQVRYRGDCR